MKYLPKMIKNVDPSIWKNPVKAWEDVCTIYRDSYEKRVPFGASFEMLCPPDPRYVANVFLRRGRLLEKDEKKKLGINPNAIVGDDLGCQ